MFADSVFYFKRRRRAHRSHNALAARV